MTESDWNRCAEPRTLLDWLRVRGRLSDRKARLFAVACCRRIWPHVVDEQGSKTVEVAERYADGNATEAELLQAHNAFHAGVYMLREARSWWGQSALDFMRKVVPLDDDWEDVPPTLHDLAVIAAASRKAVKGANVVVRKVVPVPQELSGSWEVSMAQEACSVIHEIFSNPFRAKPTIDPAWLIWNDGTVKKLAEAAYGHRSQPEGTLDQARLAVLADALEEAGCADAELLAHLRSPGPHVRGCFAVDALLGKS